MNEKTKKIILIVIGSIIKIGSTVAITVFLLKWWRSIVSAVIMIFFFLALLYVYFLKFFTTMPFLSIPETHYAEFPFEIIYSVDGEVFENRGAVISICKPDFELGEGAHCDFNTKFDESLDDNIIFVTDDYEVRIDCGYSSYYLFGSGSDTGYVPGEYVYYYFKGQKHEFTLDEAKEELGIEIISKKFSEPLKNNEYENIIIHSLKKLFKAE